jgi:hypothetical protein
MSDKNLVEEDKINKIINETANRLVDIAGEESRGDIMDCMLLTYEKTTKEHKEKPTLTCVYRDEIRTWQGYGVGVNCLHPNKTKKECQGRQCKLFDKEDSTFSAIRNCKIRGVKSMNCNKCEYSSNCEYASDIIFFGDGPEHRKKRGLE